MTDAVKLILSLSVSGGALALLLFALKWAFRHRLPKSFQYYVWLVVLLRLALPVSFGFSVTDSIFRAIDSAPGGVNAALKAPHTEIYRPNMPILVQPGEEFSFIDAVRARDESLGSSLHTVDYLLLIWVAGAVITLGIKVYGYARFSANLKRMHRSASPGEEQLLRRLSDGKVAIKRNPLARTPMLTGLFRPVIVLPDKAYSDEELLFILEHELTHYRRLDIPLKWLSLLVLCAHWFNPLAYFIHKEIDKACELSCDEAVIKALDAKGKQTYGETLISAVAPARFIGALTTMCRDKATVKERLIAIMNYKHASHAIKTLSAALIMLVVAVAGALGACVIPAKVESATKAQPERDAPIAFTVQPTPQSAAPYANTSESASHIGQASKIADEPQETAAQPQLYASRAENDEKIYVTSDSGSSDVRALQTRLNELAASHPSIPAISVNGVYDEDTKAAIIEVQRAFGLAEDGIVGKDTWFALAPYGGAAIFSKKSGEVLAVASAPHYLENGDAAANENGAGGPWIVIAPQGASAGAY